MESVESSGRVGPTAGRGRLFVTSAVLALIVVALSLRSIARFYTDFLWFESLEQGEVFTGILGAKFALFAIFTGAFFVLMLVNLIIADRLAPPFRPLGPEEELLEPYYRVVGDRKGLVRFVISFLFALIAGWSVWDQWNEWILFTHGENFGITDPVFNRDIAFYVFRLPFLSFVVAWAFAAFVIILLVTAVGHWLNGGIRVQTRGERVSPQVKAHLSVLLAVLALIKAADYYLDRFELTVSTRGAVDGATFTDRNAQLPALNLLILISLLAVALLLYNIRRRGWTLPVLAVGLWTFVNLLAGTAYPAFVQQFQVEPAESSKEAEFISLNIEATRAAYNLDEVKVESLVPPAEGARSTPEEVQASLETLRSVRILDPAIVQDTFKRDQIDRQFYQFNNVLDIDRYVVDGKLTPVVIAARELNPEGPAASWENQHVTFTHGFGVALAPANETDSSGEPTYDIGDVPIVINSNSVDLTLEQPRIYYGERAGGYAIVGAAKEETDFVSSDGANEVTETFRYDGTGGVEIGGFFRKAAFALRFNDIEPLISDLVTDDSKVIYRRRVRDRVQEVAPFLRIDSDPYSVVADDKVYYILDAYTTSSRYPYSQRADVRDLPSSSGLRGTRFNYVRNSVKAVVDAYNGSVTLYVVNDSDPIINAYRSAFPSLFADLSELPTSLQDHLRYPLDMFRVQTNMWSDYRVSPDQAVTFYEDSRAWVPAQDPDSGEFTEDSIDDAGQISRRELRIAPMYQLLQLPNETELSFTAMRPFVPFDPNDERKELAGYMVAHSDFDRYGELVIYEMTSIQVDGPSIVGSNINSERQIAENITLLDQAGSSVRFGELLLLPVDNSVVYARTLFLEAENTTIPRMQLAIVVQNGNIVVETTFEEAFEELFNTNLDETFASRTGPSDANVDIEVDPTAPVAPTDPTGPPSNIDPNDVEALIQRIIELQEQQSDNADEIAELLEDLLNAQSGDAPATTAAPPSSTEAPSSTQAPTTTTGG